MNIFKLAVLGILAGGIRGSESNNNALQKNWNEVKFADPDVCKIPHSEYEKGISVAWGEASACMQQQKPDWAMREDLESFLGNKYDKCVEEWRDEDYCKVIGNMSASIAKDLSSNAELVFKRYFGSGEFFDTDIKTDAISAAYADYQESDLNYEDNAERYRMLSDMAERYSKELILLTAKKINDWRKDTNYAVLANDIVPEDAEGAFKTVLDNIGEIAGKLSDEEKSAIEDGLSDAIEKCKEIMSAYGDFKDYWDEVCKYTLNYMKDGGEFILANLKNYLVGLEVTKTVEKIPAWAIPAAAAGGVLGIAGIITGILGCVKGKKAERIAMQAVLESEEKDKKRKKKRSKSREDEKQEADDIEIASADAKNERSNDESSFRQNEFGKFRVKEPSEKEEDAIPANVPPMGNVFGLKNVWEGKNRHAGSIAPEIMEEVSGKDGALNKADIHNLKQNGNMNDNSRHLRPISPDIKEEELKKVETHKPEQNGDMYSKEKMDFSTFKDATMGGVKMYTPAPINSAYSKKLVDSMQPMVANGRKSTGLAMPVKPLNNLPPVRPIGSFSSNGTAEKKPLNLPPVRRY